MTKHMASGSRNDAHRSILFTVLLEDIKKGLNQSSPNRIPLEQRLKERKVPSALEACDP
jgi:hypothetical protein